MRELSWNGKTLKQHTVQIWSGPFSDWEKIIIFQVWAWSAFNLLGAWAYLGITVLSVVFVVIEPVWRKGAPPAEEVGPRVEVTGDIVRPEESQPVWAGTLE